jgi:hypothetical protein
MPIFPWVFPNDSGIPYIAQITTHVADSLNRLAQQYKNKPNLTAAITAIANSVQDLENALYALLTQRLLDQAVGAQLDNLGRIVGQSRNNSTDSDYLLQLKARILLNRSSSTPNEILAIFKILCDPASVFRYVEQFPAGFNLRLSAVPITSAFASTLRAFLQAARGAGIRTILEWREWPDSQTFVFDGTTAQGFNNGHFSGAANA